MKGRKKMSDQVSDISEDPIQQPIREFSEKFLYCLGKVYEVEGGYSDHPEDKGGKTKYGITEETLKAWEEFTGRVHLGIQHLSREQATEIYYDLYWEKIKGDQIPDGLNLMVFDHAVHAGPGVAIRHMQKAIGTLADGIIGPMTLGRLSYLDTKDFFLAVHDITVSRLAIAKKSPTFWLGWFNRIIKMSMWSAALLISSSLNTEVSQG